MMVAMASDIRVILIKLADRLHNMRTIGAMPKQKQIDKAKETLEIYAPIAHRLGIHAIKWELEDLAFAALHPRKYQEIKGLVNQQREERERLRRRARATTCASELEALGIDAEISGRAKHFYSIYSKMTKKGREFNEIYDLTAMRVIVDSVKDCYGAVGVIHSLWKPLPGRFKDFIAMPKFNMYQSLHTTVIGPEGLPLEIQIRTREMHDMAEFGVAAHWIYKEGSRRARTGAEGEEKLKWLRSLLDWQQELAGPQGVHREPEGRPVRGRGLRLHAEGRGQVARRRRDAARLRLRDPHRGRPPLRRREGQRQDRAAALRAAVRRHRRGPHLQARARPVARLARRRQDDPRAQQDQAVVQGRVARGHRAHRPRAAAGAPAQGRPARRRRSPARRCSPTSSARWASARPTTSTSRSAARRSRPRSSSTRCCSASSRARPPRSETAAETLVSTAPPAPPARPARSTSYGIRVEGVDDVMLRLAKCCRPVPGDPIVGYISLGRGITIHREDCPNAAALRKDPERFVPRALGGRPRDRVQGRAPGRRAGTATACSRTCRARSPRPASTSSRRAASSTRPMVQNRFVVEVADTQALKATISRLRNIDGVFDAYRVTPGAG